MLAKVAPSTCAGAMLRFLQAMCLEEGWPLEEVLPFMTANPARILKLPSKGRIAVGCDADILLLEVGWLTGSKGSGRGRCAAEGMWRGCEWLASDGEDVRSRLHICCFTRCTPSGGYAAASARDCTGRDCENARMGEVVRLAG